jgi:hypothetical protein
MDRSLWRYNKAADRTTITKEMALSDVEVMTILAILRPYRTGRFAVLSQPVDLV